MKRIVFAALALALPLVGSAQETIDLGVIKNEDITVVQKLLYPKEGRSEMGLHLGLMPFDAFTTTPYATLSYGSFLSESFGYEIAVGGGYSLKNGNYRSMEQVVYDETILPDAYRYLASVVADAQWSPIYAKMNMLGKSVLHHDVYLLGGAGVTLEQAILPDHSLAVAPTLAVGIGARVFVSPTSTVRVQLRDDFLIESRAKTDTTHLKQNVGLTVGYTLLSKVKK